MKREKNIFNEISCQFSIKLFRFLRRPNYQCFDSCCFLCFALFIHCGCRWLAACPCLSLYIPYGALWIFPFSFHNMRAIARSLCELIKSRVRVYLLNLHENRGHVLMLASCVLLEIVSFFLSFFFLSTTRKSKTKATPLEIISFWSLNISFYSSAVFYQAFAVWQRCASFTIFKATWRR